MTSSDFYASLRAPEVNLFSAFHRFPSYWAAFGIPEPHNLLDWEDFE